MIVIISSTNRSESVSSSLAKYIQSELSTLTQEEIKIINLQDLPSDIISSALYGNKNPQFDELKNIIQSADKLYFVIPEYNGSFPGVLKVFIDGLEFPGGVQGKKAAMIGLSAGVLGGALGLSHFTDVLNYLNCSVYATKPRLTGITKIFDGSQISDTFVRNLVTEQLKGFIAF